MTVAGILATLAAYLAAINSVAYATFAYDKKTAIERGWRVSESTLLGLALFGGAIGAKLAQRNFRHKTRKQPFATLLNAALICNLVALGLFLSPGARQIAVHAAGEILGGATQGGAAETPRMPRRFGPGSGY